jgi:hypothetical protein
MIGLAEVEYPRSIYLVFGSADLGVNAYQNTNNTAIALQGGAGFRF